MERRFLLLGLILVLAVSAAAYAQNEKKPPSYVEDPENSAWIILTKKPQTSSLYLLKKCDEGENEPVTKGGKEAWQAKGVNNADPNNPDAPPYMYFRITKKTLKRGAAPHVKIIVEYFDEGEAEVGLEYDSSDEDVQKCPIPGAFKDHPEKILMEDTGKWKTFTFEIEDARFANGCNGNDFRFNFPAGYNFTVASVAVIKEK